MRINTSHIPHSIALTLSTVIPAKAGMTTWGLYFILSLAWITPSFAAEPLNALAAHTLACQYLHGEDGLEEDHEQACALFQASADLGYGPGQFNAGIMMRNGDGGPVDLERAYYYLCLAALNQRDLGDLTQDAAYYRDLVAAALEPEAQRRVHQALGGMNTRDLETNRR